MPKKKTIDEKAVKRVARLARLGLPEKEVKLYIKQLGDILNYIDKLNELDTANTPPTSHPLRSLKNVFRKDVVRKSLTAVEALSNAPQKKGDFFSVPKIV